MCFYRLLALQTAEPSKLSYLFPLFLCSLKVLLSNPKTIQKTLRAGRQMLVNVSLKERSLIQISVIEEAFTTEHWLCTGLPKSPIECICLFQ